MTTKRSPKAIHWSRVTCDKDRLGRKIFCFDVPKPKRATKRNAPALTWTRLPHDQRRSHNNHIAWFVGRSKDDVDGVVVLIEQPEVAPCPTPEKCDSDERWTTTVDGIQLESDIDQTAWSDTPYQAQQLAVPVLEDRRHAVPVDTNFKAGDLAIARALYGIIRRGYSPWEAYEWSSANDRNGIFRSFFLNPDNVKDHIDETYAQFIDDTGLSRDEVEGGDPAKRTRDKLMRGVFTPNPAKLKKRCMR